MTLLLRDDAGTVHPVLLNVSADDIPDTIAQTQRTKAAIAARYHIDPPPIHFAAL